MSQGQSSQPSLHSRKRRQTQTTPSYSDSQQPAAKKSKTSKHSSDKKRKGAKDKSRHKHSLDDGAGDFQIINSTLVVSIPPMYASNPKQGVQEILDGMLMRYIPALRGVVVSHFNLRFLDRTTTIKADCPFAVCRVSFDATVWSPQAGMKLLGKVNLCSPDHISLLVHNVFNASIPRHHIPTDHWEFEYGPADNDPEVAFDVATANIAPDENVEMGQRIDAPNQEAEVDRAMAGEGGESSDSGGRWVHKTTSENIGGTDGYLEFTVIGLTMANQMLSLLGSIQLDPFAAHHVPAPATLSPTQSQKDDEAAVLNELEIDADHSTSSDEDAFARLGKMADEAKEAEMRAITKEAVVQKEKLKKKKRQAADETHTSQPKEKKSKRKKT